MDDLTKKQDNDPLVALAKKTVALRAPPMPLARQLELLEILLAHAKSAQRTEEEAADRQDDRPEPP